MPSRITISSDELAILQKAAKIIRDITPSPEKGTAAVKRQSPRKGDPLARALEKRHRRLEKKEVTRQKS